jgi:hypothetical protein
VDRRVQPGGRPPRPDRHRRPAARRHGARALRRRRGPREQQRRRLGTKIDTANVQRCATNDPAITGAANGVRDVCPAQSKVGTGKGTAYLGDAADPITFDLGVYNVAGGAIIDIMLNDKTAFYSVAKISGRKMTVPLDQTPSLNSRITAFELSIKKAGGARQPYVRTPATCPKSRKLSASMAAREHNAGTVTTKDTTACTK